jgi:hypothetical protein
MDAARAAADAACEEKEDMLAMTIYTTRATWHSNIDRETDLLLDNTLEETDRCDAARAEQAGLLEDYKLAARERFSTWADGEREALADFVAECDEAW